MPYQRKKSFHFVFGIVVSLVCAVFFFSVAQSVLAQNNIENGDVFGTAQIDQNTALGKESLQHTVVRIINVGLGFLGIIALGIVLYGGFVYMTSGGSEDKIATAKKILINGTIGLIIILSAWAITKFVLNQLGDATNVAGMGGGAPSACQDPQYANDNPEQCLGGGWGNIPGGDNVDCAVKNKAKVLMVRGITPSTPAENESTGMNNAKVRVLFNNPLAFAPADNPMNNADAQKLFSVFRVENGSDVDVTASFGLHFVHNDPALIEAVFVGQNGLDQLPQGQYKVKVNKELKGRANQALVEEVPGCKYPTEAMFQVNTDGIIDNQKPVVSPFTLNGQPADLAGETLQRGRVQTLGLSITDNSGVGVVHYHVSVMKNNAQVSTMDYFDIPKVSRGSHATAQDPFLSKFPLLVAGNAELFTTYQVTAHVFDIDGNSTDVLFTGIIVGANCGPGVQGPECLDENRSCNNDLECPSKKCINNQCVAWPVITNVNGSGNNAAGVWEGAAGNYVTIQGNYFGENTGHVYFGFEQNGDAMNWVEATLPQCDGRDLWHNEWVIVALPDDVKFPQGSRAVIKVQKAPEVEQAEGYFDTTIDNHGPIPGPNVGRFIKNNVKRPGICAVGVAPGNPNIPAGATRAPIGTALQVVGTAFGASENGSVHFGTVQGEVTGWSDAMVATRVPGNVKPGIVPVHITQAGVESNNVPFTVSSTIYTNRPSITFIDPVTSTRRSYITISGKDFGESTGEVFLAPSADTNCRPEGRFNDQICKIMSTQTCGESWSDTQIIAQVPENANLKQYVVIVERAGDMVTSQGNNIFTVEAGDPNPSICYFQPKTGPSPLPSGHPGLRFRGINFSDTPKIYFFPKGADEKDINTWMVQQGAEVHKILAESPGFVTTVTTSLPVVNGLSLGKGSSPIVLKNAQGKLSNRVVYTVNDCKDSPPMEGYQCCTEGPDAGFFKLNNQVCRGQTRNAGYAWRFTTGRIPEFPEIVENCVTSTPDNQPPVFPSPAPWQNWLGSDLACVNQNVVVKFRLPQNASLLNVNRDTVKVYSCAEQNGRPDCTGQRKVLLAYDNDDMHLPLDGGDTLTIISNPMQGPAQLATNTWYHVEISKDIQSTRNIQVAGGVQVERQNLLAKRPCSDTTAYCFDFKTGGDNNRCTLDRVGVLPHPFTVNYLGVLQLPGFYDANRMFNPLPQTTLFYNVWGSGNQDCSVLNVGGYNWNWDTTDHDKATVVKKEDSITRARVTALENTVPQVVGIQARTQAEDGEKLGTADLTIDLGEPKVVDFWPSCTESCTGAELGARFNRQMFIPSYNGNVRLFKCADELCANDNPGNVELGIEESVSDYFTYRFLPIRRVEVNGDVRVVHDLEKGTWYKIILTSGIQGIEGFGANLEDPSDDIGGKHLAEFSWKFRTTSALDGACIADKVEVQPNNFVARQIGERTRYNALPRTAPNACSKLGQNLNPWIFGWEWKVTTRGTTNVFPVNREVAKISNFAFQGNISQYCGVSCLPLGSNVSANGNGRFPVCGDGFVGPGEDCDIAKNGEIVGVTCSLNCLRTGNTQRGVNPEAVECGNGVVDNPGVNAKTGSEECDPGILAQRDFCTNTCVWKGGSARVDNVTSTLAWCGSGDVALGEECDIANSVTTTPEGPIGCSAQCIHVGTPMSQDWCTVHANDPYGQKRIKDLPQCKLAISVCGNGVLENGEECEASVVQGEPGVLVALEGGRSVFAQVRSEKACTNRCLLGDICGLNAIPDSLHNGPRCEKGKEGCTNECHVAGSSVAYSTPSFCGDARKEIGENPICEVAAAAQDQQLGQNPVQMVTAVGKGELNETSRNQEADIIAKVIRMKDENGAPKLLARQVSGVAPYGLQCGFTENIPVSSRGNLLERRDGNMELDHVNAWTLIKSQGEESLIEKTNREKFGGERSMHVTGTGFLSQKGLSVESGKTYVLSFDYKLATGTLWAFEFTREAQRPERANLQGILDDISEFSRTANNVNDAAISWLTYRRIVTVPQNYNVNTGDFGITIDFENADAFIDNVSLEEFAAGKLIETTNDCGGDESGPNTNNRYGVGSNSCCYSRKHRVSSVPAYDATNVCRNAFLSIDFNGFIDQKSLQDNVVLVSGHGNNFVCSPGDRDVSLDIRKLLPVIPVAPVQNNAPLQLLWNDVKHFFARLFGLGIANAVDENLTVWCAHLGAVQPKVTFDTSFDLQSVTSTVSLQLSAPLLPSTQYGLLVVGGNAGVTDNLGVGVRSEQLQNGKYTLHDFIPFKTGNEICKIDHVTVEPSSYLYIKPNTTSTFEASVISSDRNQRVQSLPGIYAWEWDWSPQNNPIFEIPVAGTSAESDIIDIKAKNLEGKIIAAGIAHVTDDVSTENNQKGKVFSAPTTLTANFCENMWPPREYYPFEEGISFGNHLNQDGFTAAGEFNGSELPAVRVGDVRNGTDAYFNVSFHYCADANKTSDTSDDLPYLKPLLFANKEVGHCELPAVQENCQILPNGRRFCARGAAVDPAAAELPETCSVDTQCQQVDSRARCVGRSVASDASLADDTLKKFLFVNDRNDDAIGLQIYQNPKRYSPRAWYEQKFPGVGAGALRDITIGGYDAVTDGQNYYVNALNQNGDINSNIYNQIYIFSINGNAQADSKKVFEQIISSLEFNINISDIGFCLAEDAANVNAQQILLQNVDRLTEITSQSCKTDFDCRDASGNPAQGMNGVCSNAKTKLLRDWKRLADIRLTQNSLELYKVNKGGGKYPQFDAGSFVPGYTNSRWTTSWNDLKQQLGSAPVDPINNWTSCGNLDKQTCWDAAAASVQCPLYSSIIEYNTTSSGYMLHVPLEYFRLSGGVINPVVREIVPYLNMVTTQPWCEPEMVKVASAGQCGNGVVNIGSGEECDPPGSASLSNMGLMPERPGHCQITNEACLATPADCGYELAFSEPNRPNNNPGLPNNHTIGLSQKLSYCSFGDPIGGVILDEEHKRDFQGKTYYPLFSCESDQECTNIAQYSSSNSYSVPAANNARAVIIKAQMNNFLQQNGDQVKCTKVANAGGQIVLGNNPNVTFPDFQPQRCIGAIARGGTEQCDAGEVASKYCSSDCHFSYGMCRLQGDCGDGRVTGSEVCDSGALNGTYGHCAGQASFANQPDRACKEMHPQYCGNGRLDRQGNAPLELCEGVSEMYIADIDANGKGTKFALSGLGKLALVDVCGPTEPVCSMVPGNGPQDPAREVCIPPNQKCIDFRNRVLAFVNTPNAFAKRCEGDKTLVCQNDADCIEPLFGAGAVDISRQNIVGLGQYLEQNLPNIAVNGDELGDGGPCVPVANIGNFGSPYSPMKELSCTASSCSAVGEYCGDGKVQSPYEQCDDKNNVNGDGCTKYCQSEALAQAQAAPEANLACGNNRVDQGEACDTGRNQNGRMCTPQYGRACTYCSADCLHVLSVDPNAFCGDNVFAAGAEQCDVVNGDVVRGNVVGQQVVSCPQNYKGSYSCNQCNSVTSNCTLCKEDAHENGAVPVKLSFINPMFFDGAIVFPGNVAWKSETDAGLFAKRDVLANASLVRPPKAPEGTQFYLETITGQNLNRHHLGSFIDIFDADRGLVAGQLCANEYGLVFNRSRMNAAGVGCENGSCPDPAEYIMEGKSDFFEFDTSRTGNNIENEYVVSPALPNQYVRIVVRWSKELSDLGYTFQGILHNSGFSNGNRDLKFSDENTDDANSNICSIIKMEPADGLIGLRGYWVPDCVDKFLENSVYIHPIVTGQQVHIQSMTVKLNGGIDVLNADNQDDRRNYAFAVEAITREGNVPMAQLLDKEVYVDVYTYKEGQNPKYSIYKPTKTYALSAAAVGNPTALYWHVFNFELGQFNYDRRAPHKTYTILNAQGQEVSKTDTYEFGKMATNMNEVICFMQRSPDERCRVE